jgi:hypothetical protein
MKNLILEGGNNPQSIQARGLFSFVVQYVSVHRAYFDDNDGQKSVYDEVHQGKTYIHQCMLNLCFFVA